MVGSVEIDPHAKEACYETQMAPSIVASGLVGRNWPVERRKKMGYRKTALWAACILGIMFLMTGCGYLESKEEIAAWVKVSMQANIQKDDAYKGISIGEVALVRESPSKFTGYVEFKSGTDTEKSPLTVIIDGDQKIYQCDPPRALILRRNLGQLGKTFKR